MAAKETVPKKPKFAIGDLVTHKVDQRRMVITDHQYQPVARPLGQPVTATNAKPPVFKNYQARYRSKQFGDYASGYFIEEELDKSV